MASHSPIGPKCVPLRGTVALLLAAAVACSGKDMIAPKPPASLAAVSAASVSGVVGAPLLSPPAFVVKDASGNALGGVSVTLAVTAGGGTLTGAPTRTGNGPTPVGSWMLGPVAGANTVTVAVGELPPLTISANGTPDAPSVLTVLRGNNQSAPGGAAVAERIQFKLADRFGNGVPGIAVAFQVTAGEGWLPGGTVGAPSTDASGVATAPAWTLGKLAVPQLLTAAASRFTATASATVGTQYRVDVRFYGPEPDSIVRAAFVRAANRVSAEVTGRLPSVTLTNFDLVANCDISGVPALNETIDGLLIFVSVRPIDGPGGILAEAGPCIIRSTGKLTLIGDMIFDVADIQGILLSGQLHDVMMHEMQHVLGFGTLWTSVNPPLIVNSGTAQTAFTGPRGIQGCLQARGGAGTCTPTIALENRGGPGTADSHWRKTIFGNELLTGFLAPPGVAAPLSAMTIGSLGDLGYETNVGVADDYLIPSALASLFRDLRGTQTLSAREVMLMPRYEVTRGGRTKPLR